MIPIIPIQEAYRTKIERQEKLQGLKFKCHGSCAYIGDDISPGCYGCFYSGALHFSFMLGRDFGLPDVCNRDCVYCFKPHIVQNTQAVTFGWKLSEEWQNAIMNSLVEQKQKISPDFNIQYYEFSGASEPLLYLPVLEEVMLYLRNAVDRSLRTRGWAKIYTNGTLLNLDNILKLKSLGFDEVRVHPAASGFSSAVYENMRLAVKHIPTVTVETPSWEPHREKLFEMLPVIQDIGVKHLDICQVEIAHPQQLERIEKALGEVRIYQAYYPVMDDGGLVEDIMHEVLDKGYTYSVLDCNGFVKQSRSALSIQSYWSVLNQRYPPEWQKQRYERRIR